MGRIPCHRKIGLAIGDYANNYGTVLQAFATLKKVRDMGFDAEAINFNALKKSIRNRKLRYFAGKIFDSSIVREKGRILTRKLYKLVNREFKRNEAIKSKLFSDFRRKNITRSREFTSWDDLTRSCREYSAVIVGSDQVWLPSQIAADFFTLNFVPDDIKKISYASSFGVPYVEHFQEDKARKFLSRINYLSVREKSGQEIVKNLTGRDAELVCDPTMLLTRDEWDEISQSSKFIHNQDKYILCYFLGTNKWHREFARKLADITAMKIIALPCCDQYVRYDTNGYADETPYDITPQDFIRLIRNAEYICTDSFHGTIFSLIYGKKSLLFRRFSGKWTLSTNTRLESIAERMHIQERFVNPDDNIDHVLDRINNSFDYDVINHRVGEFRKSSLKFLINALEA